MENVTTQFETTPHILIVDDEPQNIKVLASALEKRYTLSFATSGEDALRLAHSQRRPDMMLVDVMMPDMNGFQVCSELKAKRATANIPIVFVTALDDRINEEKGLELGAVDYINKPISPSIVRARVRMHLELKQHRELLELLLERRTVDLETAQHEARNTLGALRESEAKLRAFMDHAPEGLSLKDLKGRYVMANAAFGAMAGIPTGEILGKTDRELGLRQNPYFPSIATNEYQVIGSGKSISHERSGIAPDGSERNWMVTKFPALDENGKAVAIGTIHADVTQQKLAEKALRESEQSFRTLIEGSVQGIAIHRDWKPLFANRAFADILGFDDPEEFVALETMEPIFAPYERERLKGYRLARVKGEPAPDQYEFDALGKDGSTRTLQTAVSNTTWNGEPAVQVAVIDITNRKRAEAAQRASEARMAAFFDNSPHGLTISDLNGHYVQVNPASGRLSGRDRRDMVGKHFSEVQAPELVDKIAQFDRQIIDSGESVEYEVALPKPGGPQNLRVTAFPIRDANEQVTGVCRLTTDITEHRQAQASLHISEARFRAFFDNSPHAMSIQDPDGRYLQDNPQSHALYGQSETQTRGKLPREVWPADIAENVEATNRRVRETRRHVEYENEVPVGDAIKQVHVTKFPIIDANQRFLGIGSIGSDITARKQAESELEQSRLRFRDFAEASSDWFWEMGPDLRVTSITEQSIRSLGTSTLERFNATREGTRRSEVPTELTREWQRFWKLVESNRPIRNMELPARDESGVLRYIRTSGKPIRDEDEKFLGYRGVGSDVTDVVESRRQAEALRNAIDVSADAVILYDTDQRVVFTNDEYHRVFPQVPPKDAIVGEARSTLIQTIATSDWVRRPEVHDPETYVQSTLEEDPPGEWMVNEQTFANGRTYLRRRIRFGDGDTLAVFTDITVAKETEAELRRLASEVSLAEEKERRRISAELHDGAVQNLGLTRIKFGSLRQRLADSDAAAGMDEIRDLLDQSIREVRSLMSELSPPMLYELGLEPAVEWLADRFRNRHSLECVVESDEAPKPLSSDVEVSLFQAVRELLVNVVKHANASRVNIGVHRMGGALRILIHDNGVGINPAKVGMHPSDTGGFGLFSLRERLGLLGGEMRIESDQGTRVTMTVPLERV